MPDGKPKKKDYSGAEGTVSQAYYDFLMNTLWKPNGRQVRNAFISASQEQLQALLRTHKIPFEEHVKILVVDLETGRANGFKPEPSPEDFYTLVLPPEPRRNENEPHYKTMQGWAAAYYHAINDSYGM